MKREMKNRPYVENYPPLHDWLRKREATCSWQVPLGEPEDPRAYVEQWSIRDWGLFVVIVHADRHGWDIYTGGKNGDVAATLEDAERRLSAKYK